MPSSANCNHICADYYLIANVFNLLVQFMVYKHSTLILKSVENTSLNQQHRLHNYYTDIIHLCI